MTGTTRVPFSPDVRALVTSTQPRFGGGGSELSGIENYMTRKMKGAQLVEPGSVRVLSTVGDQTNAVVTITLRIRLGADATMVTMARACVYAIDDSRLIKEERDVFCVLSP